MKHLSPEDLSALLDGAAAPARMAEMESHLAGCVVCRDALAGLAAQDLELKQSLSHDPGEAYFESFASRVRARIDAGEPAVGGAAREPSSGRQGVFGWLLGPVGLRWAGAAAALIVAVGVVFTLGREGRLGPARSTLEDRAAQTAPAEPPASTMSEAAPPVGEAREQAGADAPAATRSEPASSSDADAANDRRAARESAPAPATGAARGTEAPSRMKEARRTPEGDEVPARVTERPFAAAPAPPNAPEAGKSRAVKQPAAPLAAGGSSSGTGASKATEGSSTTAAPPAAVAKELRALARDQQKAKEETRDDLVAPGSDPNALALRSKKSEPVTLPFAATQLCGTVVDAMGRPVPRATVVMTATKATAITGADGRFCLPAAAGTATLAVYALGYKPERQAVRVPEGAAETVVALDPVPVLETGRIGSAYRSEPGLRGKLELKMSGDAFASWPAGARELAREADHATREAVRLRSAAKLDEAAGDWGRVVVLLEGRDEQVPAREYRADAAWRAWEIEPTRARAATAAVALDAYLEHAPKGAARDLALERRARLRTPR